MLLPEKIPLIQLPLCWLKSSLSLLAQCIRELAWLLPVQQPKKVSQAHWMRSGHSHSTSNTGFATGCEAALLWMLVHIIAAGTCAA